VYNTLSCTYEHLLALISHLRVDFIFYIFYIFYILFLASMKSDGFCGTFYFLTRKRLWLISNIHF
jgi:hypothetical protein